jgi:hypothetical protein
VVEILPPFWLIRVAVAGVWLYEGLWCKLLGRAPRQIEVAQAIPFLGPRAGGPVLKAIGFAEVALAAWALSGWAPIAGAIAQTLFLLILNVNGLLWARRFIHDPGGMVVKNFAFLVLVWVSASLPGPGR